MYREKNLPIFIYIDIYSYVVAHKVNPVIHTFLEIVSFDIK